jgi:metal-dependent amidase/aminoacylase/carboxypeptidase family protein
MATIGKTIGEANVEIADQSMGGEDFGRFGGAGVPIAMLSVGSVEPERLAKLRENGGLEPSLHSPKYYPDIEPTITTGVTALASAAVDLLSAEGE